MGSVGFDGEDESQPSTSNGKKYKLPRTLLDDCGAINYASFPKKLRTAIKKRGRESVTSLLPISRKQHHVSNGVETLRKDTAKKSKLNMKKLGHVSKDEEEVAQTLYALADMFSDANKANQPELDDEPLQTKSSPIPEAGSLNAIEATGVLTVREDSKKISSKVTIEAACHSSIMVDSTEKVVKFQSLSDTQQPELPTSKQPSNPSNQAIDLEQDAATGIQPGMNYPPMDERYNGLLLDSMSATGARVDSRNCGSQPHVVENCINAEKHTHVAVEPKKSWKGCSAHVYICRLIKVLQIYEKKEVLLEKPTQLTTCGGAELHPRMSVHNQTTGVNGRNGVNYFSGLTKEDSAKIQNDILLLKRPLQDSETSALCSSAKQGYNFLSLGTGVSGLDAGEGVHRAGHSHEAAKQFHVPYMQSQNHSAMLFSAPQNGYSSSFHGQSSALQAQQIQLSQYLSSTFNSGFTGLTGQRLESQQQKWHAQLPTQYNTTGGGGVGAPHLAQWRNGGRDSSSMLNYAPALFPHLHAALGSKYQQISPQQHQQHMAMNSSLPLPNVKRHHHHLSLGFERNGTGLYPENIPQLHQHL